VFLLTQSAYLLLCLTSRQIDGAYSFSKIFKAGVETGIGIGYQYLADGGGDMNYTDIPARIFCTFSFGLFFTQLYGGYYFALIRGKSLAGPEFGFKVGFFGVYLTGSFIIAQESNFRIGIGLLLGN
jgi:hypothetical protein